VEWTNHYRPVSWAEFDLDLSCTHVRFIDDDVVGNYISGSPAFIGSADIVLGEATGWFGALFWRCLGPRPLIEDGSVFSGMTSLFNARPGYVFQNGLKLQLDGFNIFNTQANQISRRAGGRRQRRPLPSGRAAGGEIHGAEGILGAGIGRRRAHSAANSPLVRIA
jgi:hypothetical protein